MMFVKKLVWLSKAGQEAELIVSDGQYECFVFCHPCYLSEGESLKEPLLAGMPENLMLSEKQHYFIKQLKEGLYDHACIAEVVNRSKSLVKIGGLFIVLGEDLPVGCDEGTFVEFSCDRLDA